ncbi:MAG: alpha/beta hydrolase [Gemmatimonadales bacterium]
MLPIPLLTALTTVAPTQATDTVHDVPYAAGAHPEQRLDFSWPVGASATVLFIHGGSLSESGERRDSPMYASVCAPFLAAGIACATTDYRLAPTFRWPAMPEDIAAAILKVRALIAGRGGDPDRLFLFGHSSGCTLAAVVAADATYLTRVGLQPAQIAGVILMGCALDNEDAALKGWTADDIREGFARSRSDVERFGTPEHWLAANPSRFAGPHMPPVRVVVANAERFFPPILEQGARFVRRLLEYDVPADLVIVPASHRSSIARMGRSGDLVFAAVRAFLEAPRRSR